MNDCLRWATGATIRFLGRMAASWLRFRILLFNWNQKRFKQKYGITRDTPVLLYGSQVVQSIGQAADTAGRDARFARTSGSTGKAKEILYTTRRLRTVKWTFSDMFARACAAFQIRRTCLYVFNSFQTDDSLTSLLLNENELPGYVSTLQAPYRVQRHQAIQSLVVKYGAAAVRLWILTISNPGVLYSTNPSTLSTFLDELVSDWRGSSKLIRDWYSNTASFDPELQRIARRLASRGCSNRIKLIATTDVPLPLSICAPAVQAYICWTGGYVQPFLDRLAKHLPSPRYQQIPMYSMSTESIETVPYFQGEDVAFLPLAPGVLYEFIEETDVDHPHNLLNPQQLEPGKLYSMVVSDNYGLRRYQTDDLFLCKRKINGLPDLVFVRRRSLQYSFTGEKLTAEQLSTVFEQLRAAYPELLEDRFLTCMPTQTAHAIPHYQLLIVGDHRSHSERSHDLIAMHCDELLSAINCEYSSKRASGRLGPVTCIDTRVKDFAEQLAQTNTWETQFKFLPLHVPVLRTPVCPRVS